MRQHGRRPPGAARDQCAARAIPQAATGTAPSIPHTGGDLSAVGRGCDEQFEVEFALDLLLDGVARLHEGRWRSA